MFRVYSFFLAVGLFSCAGCERHPDQDTLDLPASALSTELSLASAIENGNLQQTRTLMTGGMDPNAPIEGGFPPLHLAAFQGRVEIGKLLINLGANVNGSASPSDVNGRKPLHVAVSRSQLAFVKFLLQNWANPNLPDSLQQTPLDLAGGKAALLEHRLKLSRDTSDKRKREIELKKTRNIQKLLQDHGGKTTSEMERDKLDEKIRTQNDESLIEKSSRYLKKSKAKSSATKPVPSGEPKK